MLVCQPSEIPTSTTMIVVITDDNAETSTGSGKNISVTAAFFYQAEEKDLRYAAVT